MHEAFRVLDSETLTATTTAAQTAAAPAGTRAVRIATIGQPAVASIGMDPTAAAGDITVAANDAVVLECTVGEKVSVLRQGATDAPTNVAFLG